MANKVVGSKTLVLGSAQWGWTISKPAAFKILDAWIDAGMREVDCATNYPINKNPADFRASENILFEYLQAHGLHDMRITMKIGSLDNMRSPVSNLAPSFVLMMGEEYYRLFGGNLRCLMFHWDNRDDTAAVRSSLEALKHLQQEMNIDAGISGIAHPDVYAQANADCGLIFDIQLKHNLLQSDLGRYRPLFIKSSNDTTGNPVSAGHRCFAYGINAGGIKLDAAYGAESTFLARGGQPEKAAKIARQISSKLPEWNTAFVRPPLKTMNQIGLIHAGLNPNIHGIVLGVSTTDQLRQTLDFWQNPDTFDYSDVFDALEKIARSPLPEAGNY
ncbi:MAG: aldo/keto reductase [Lewinellaceae bacterium]|nr:aldo/keto reductase [Lewinellaceae bacterium]